MPGKRCVVKSRWIKKALNSYKNIKTCSEIFKCKLIMMSKASCDCGSMEAPASEKIGNRTTLVDGWLPITMSAGAHSSGQWTWSVRSTSMFALFDQLDCDFAHFVLWGV